MYRSLLCQILEKTNIRQIFEDTDLSRAWTIERLRELFTSAIRLLGRSSIKCYIDALDECDEREVRDMIVHFEGLGRVSDGYFCVCFASRHYPTIIVPDDRGLQIVLECENGHNEDLTEYIRKHLKIGSGKLHAQLEAKLHQKANSVFMWAVLVVDILNEEYRRGSIFAVEQRLKDIPVELSALFEDILLRDNTRKDHLLLCIQWVLFSNRPLELKEYYFAMATGLAGTLQIEWDPELVAIQAMQRYVSDSSKGLAELTKSKGSQFVQFIHESVRDFLLKDGGLKRLWPELGAEPESSSHARLSQCCQRVLCKDVTYHITPMANPLEEPHDKEQASRLKQKFPCVKYAAEHIFYHADKLVDGTAMGQFLAHFDFANWILIFNSMAQYKTRRFNGDASVWYILASRNSSGLIARLPERGEIIPASPSQHFGHPLLAAIAHRCWNSLRAVLEPYNSDYLEEAMESLEKRTDAVVNGTSPLLWAIRKDFEPLATVLVTSSLVDLRVSDRQNRSPIRLAAEKDFSLVVKHLLLVGVPDSDVEDALGIASAHGNNDSARVLIERVLELDSAVARLHCQRALNAALSNNQTKTLRLLLDAGAGIQVRGSRNQEKSGSSCPEERNTLVGLLSCAGPDVSANDSYYSNLLKAACRSGYDTLVKQFLNTGADINAKRLAAGRVVQALCDDKQEQVDMVRVLLDAGADVKASENYSCNALSVACKNGYDMIVKLLLDAGADVNAKINFYGGSPLHAACVHGKDTTVKLLLDAGADVNKGITFRDSQLHAACIHRKDTTVKLLLDAGAEVNREGVFHDSPLHAACVKGRDTIVKLLLDAGADVNHRGFFNESPLEAACAYGRDTTVKLLLDAGADVNLVVEESLHGSPLEAACTYGIDTIVKLLLDAGAEAITVRDEYSDAIKMMLLKAVSDRKGQVRT